LAHVLRTGRGATIGAEIGSWVRDAMGDRPSCWYVSGWRGEELVTERSRIRGEPVKI
jgi:hypothetical protein